MTRFITIRVFNDYITAYVVRATLEDNGITCFLKDENVATVWGSAVCNIKLQVPENEKEKAEALLTYSDEKARAQRATPGFLDEDTEQLDPGNRVCIHCGSKNTRRLEDKKDSPFLSWLFSGLSISFESDKWHCFHCGGNF